MSDDEKRVSENADGTVIVRLHQPIKVGKDEHERVTVRAVRSREARVFYAGGTEEFEKSLKDVCKMMDFCNMLSDPPNAADEARCDSDLGLLLNAAQIQLGKYLATGKRG